MSTLAEELREVSRIFRHAGSVLAKDTCAVAALCLWLSGFAMGCTAIAEAFHRSGMLA